MARTSQNRIRNFLDDLLPQFEAQRREKKKNRNEFNVLDYLKTDEHGLSRIIADLLNPKASHGQGMLFLETLLTKLNVDCRHIELFKEEVQVDLEYRTPNGRFIDICVASGQSFCLAIENKPYAGDQHNQVWDYLKSMEQGYKYDFLLIYLSPSGDLPSEYSLPPNEYEHWKDHLKIIAYWCEPDDMPKDTCKDFRTSFSLANWFEECRECCKETNLGLFLNDLSRFCISKFGDEKMRNSAIRQLIEDTVFDDFEKYSDLANSISEEWPKITMEIYNKFFNAICIDIQVVLNQEIDNNFTCSKSTPVGVRRGYWWFHIRNEYWSNYGKAESCVFLSTYNSGHHSEPAYWWIGLYLGPDNDSSIPEDCRAELLSKLKRVVGNKFGYLWQEDPEYPLYIEPKIDWTIKLPQIRQYLNGNSSGKEGGEIKDKFAGEFVDFIKLLDPVMKEHRRELDLRQLK